MGLFIDDGQQFEHVIEAEGETLAVTYRLMGTDDVQALLMLLDRTSPHYQPLTAYRESIPRMAKCIVQMTCGGRTMEPAECLPRLGFGEFAELRNVVMGLTRGQQEARGEQAKN